MRMILAVLCLFWGSLDDVAAESLDTSQKRKIEHYRTLLVELASSDSRLEAKGPIDLPEGLKNAIEDWTRS
ncbi:hypothetical protein AB4Y85_09970 [Microvirga sp. 2YAF29]|uniref:hypothetical protein n=1 Tax=Microvirga sp. 2YAF29 TaxID=3233031 RepID=UPI003F9D65AF